MKSRIQWMGIMAAMALVAGALLARAEDNTTNIVNSGNEINSSGEYTWGANGCNNVLIITNGGMVSSVTGYIGKDASANNNTVIISGTGSLWSVGTGFDIGDRSSGNKVYINNGARARSTAAYLGYYGGANDNAVHVSGAGSTFNVGEGLFIGNGGSGNSLTISDGGNVYSGEGATIGPGPKSLAIINGTSSVWTASGGIAVGGEPGSCLKMNGGTVSGSILVKSGSTLTGSGTVGSVTLEKDAILDPVGKLTVNGALTLNAGTKLTFELGSPKTAGKYYSHVEVQGTLDLGGVKFGNFTFTTRDGFGPGTYQLFACSTINGKLGAMAIGIVGGKKGKLSLVGENTIVLNVSR